jgi:hypothetical protein
MTTRLIIDDTEPAIRCSRITKPRTGWQTFKDTMEALVVIVCFIACIAAVFLA